MRLEASVPSEDLSELRVGATVDFAVRGYDQPFQGRIERIAPQADPTTRQVPIYVAIPNVGGRLVAACSPKGGWSAVGDRARRADERRQHDRTQTPWVLRVADGKTERVDVTLGLRDPRTRARADCVRAYGRRHAAARRRAGHHAGNAVKSVAAR